MPEARAGIRLFTKYSGEAFRKARQDAKATATTINNSLGKVGLGLGLAAATAGILQFRKESIELAREQARVEAQLNAVLESTGHAAGLTATEIKDMASEFQKVTNFGDEATIAGQNILLTFDRISEETFPRATAAMLDMSAALGQDLPASAKQIGRALQDLNVEALTRSGTTFTEQQKEQIETLRESGRRTEAMAIILGELEKQYGGSAEAAREADGGVQALANSYGDLQEAIGRILQPQAEANEGFIKILDTLTPAVNALADFNIALTETKDTGNEFQDSLLAVNDFISLVGGGQIVKIGDAILQWAFNNEELTETLDEVRNGTEAQTQAVKAQAQAVNELTKEEQKRLERVEEIRRDTLRDLMEIEDDFQKESAEAWDDYHDDVERETQRHEDRIEDIREQARKEQLKADQKLARDLLKVDADLAKSQRRLQEDTDKNIRRMEEDAKKEQARESKSRQIDTLQDERLFQFELRQLAAEGEGNAIAAALERRAIEEEIAAERQQDQDQQAQEDLRLEIDRAREDAAIREQRLREDAEDRKRILREEAELERQLRQEELETSIAEENKAHKERLDELEKFNKERLDDIEETKKESIAKTAEELTTIEDITETELRELSRTAADLGYDVGVAFALGLNEGFSREQQIDSLLDDLGVSGYTQGGGSQGYAGTHRYSGSPVTPLMFQHGGQFRVGGSGGPDSQLVNFLASPGETVTVTPPGQTMSPVFNINATGEGGTQLATILERKVNEALQEYTDTIIVPVLQ